MLEFDYQLDQNNDPGTVLGRGDFQRRLERHAQIYRQGTVQDYFPKQISDY